MIDVFDRDGVQRDMAWLQARFGSINIQEAPASGQPVFRLARIDVRAGPATLAVSLQNSAGGPLTGYQIAEFWSDAPTDLSHATGYKRVWQPRACVQQTDSRGVTDYPYAGDGFVHLPNGGPFGAWVLSDKYDSDLVEHIGWINDHETPNLTFRLIGTQPPAPTPPPATDGDLAALVTSGFDKLSRGLDRLQAAIDALATQPAPQPQPARKPTCFSQRDSRWSNQTLGAGPGTIGTVGCLIAAVASCLVDLGINTDPGRLNLWLSRNNGFENGNKFRWYSLGDLSVTTVDLIDCQTVDAPLAKLRAYLAQGLGVVVLVDYNPKTEPLESHWVRLLSLDADGCDGDIMDPWQLPGQELGRLSRYLGTGYDGKVWNDTRGIFGVGAFAAKG